MQAVDLALPQDDADAVQRLARSLARGSTEAAAELFARNDSRAPVVVWHPAPADIRHPVLRRFADMMAQAAPERGPVPWSALERMDFRDIAGWTMILEQVGPADYRYRQYGAEIAAIYGQDMTGRRTSDFGGHVSTFFLALYRAAAKRREWVKSEHEPPRSVFARSWRRLIVPLAAESGAVTGFAVVNLSSDELRPGLEAVPDPVLLVSEEGGVLFANAAAQEVFGPRSFAREPIRFEAYCGFPLELSPADGSRMPARSETRAVARHGPLVVQFRVTRRSLYHRDNLCHVVVVKPS